MRDSFIFHLYTNMKSIFIQQILSGSSFVSPALGGVGQGRLNTNDKFPPKKIGRSPKTGGPRRKVLRTSYGASKKKEFLFTP